MADELTKKDFDTGINTFICYGRAFDMREPDWENKMREYIKLIKGADNG